MSIIPQENLKAVNSFELKTFELSIPLDDVSGDTFRMDTITQYDSFWKIVTLRNLNENDAIFYRIENGGKYDVIPPLSERDVPGWGSYFEVKRLQDTEFVGKLIFQLVKRENAIVKSN